ncbi:hypothetical protein FVEG_17701 [Fusarium verticillioides 7600]|uniref:Uncharacterized protein n=1 Tax=Gibberella moniliformis (strain M3125 / FGSC 7600) TaxID=334819 RepID=A0A139YBR8_GIBM7|nr:hypothetical protein FVEG_17701 [Fusarium verticillioides 7600]KYG13781.1 hypothetical protein FVEG_17701 [Fusarium verticillioides 7600]
MLSRQENIVTRVKLPERCDAASGESRTVWPEGVVREFMAIEFKRGETPVIDPTGVDDDDEGSLFVAQGEDLEAFEPDSQPQPPSEYGQRISRRSTAIPAETAATTPNSAATTTIAPSHTSRASTIPMPQDHGPLDRTFEGI